VLKSEECAKLQYISLDGPSLMREKWAMTLGTVSGDNVRPMKFKYEIGGRDLSHMLHYGQAYYQVDAPIACV
jgi:hypothetical protein